MTGVVSPGRTQPGATPAREAGGAGLTVKEAVRVLPYAPVITAECVVATEEVVTAKVALVAPCDTVTDAGTETAASFDEIATRAPLAAAGPFRVTVPVEGDPPTTEAGSREIARSVPPAIGPI